VNRTMLHEGNEVREFYSQRPQPVLVGIEAIGPRQWFLNLLDKRLVSTISVNAAIRIFSAIASGMIDQEASEEFDAGTQAREHADQYVRVTVTLATVLLLAALSQRFKPPKSALP